MSQLLYWSAATNLTVLVTVNEAFSVEHIELARGAVPSEARSIDEVRESMTSAGFELERAIRRLAGLSHEVMLKRLERLARGWLRSRRGVPILQEDLQPAPRLFVDRVGSNVADISWEPLGGGQVRAAFFEIALFGYGTRSRRTESPQLQKLGTFAAPSGNARSYRLVRLEPVRWHRAKVRAVGPDRSWVSEWSNEVSFRTVSLLDARDAGCHVASEAFLVKSERLIQKCVTDHNLEGPLPLPTREDLRVQQVRQLLGPSTQLYGHVTTKLLNARYSKGGWPDFVKHGARFSRPAALREERLKRMQLVIAAEELYGPAHPRANEWCQGPFYYESTGLRMLQRNS